MGLNLDTILKAGLIMSFILPMLALVATTLPQPPVPPGGINITQEFNQTGALIYNQVSGTYLNTSQTLLGNCGAPIPPGVSQNTINNGKNCSGSLYSNPTIFQAFAFILQGIGTVITDIIQLPYVDYESLQLMELGMYTVLPGFPLQFMAIGIDALYIYMAISLLLMGVGLIQKYNPKVG